MSIKKEIIQVIADQVSNLDDFDILEYMPIYNDLEEAESVDGISQEEYDEKVEDLKSEIDILRHKAYLKIMDLLDEVE